MGHQLLTILIAAALWQSVAWSRSAVEEIDRLVAQIKAPRVGLENRQIQTAKDPFIYMKEGKPMIKRPTLRRPKGVKFYLSAIVDKRIKINGKWYGLGQKVQGYAIAAIIGDSVVLKKRRKTIRVFMLKTRSKKIKMTKHQG
jgi:hypothetical protein